MLPNQGRLGLFTKDGAGSFDNLLVRGDDPMFAATPQLLTAASVPAATAVPAPSIQTWQLTPIITAAYDRWARALGVSSAVLKSRYNLSFMVGDLSGSALSEVSGNSVIIDVNAAGNGWYVDPTPKNDSEFRRRHGALVAASAQAGKGVDLLTAVMHEIGHAIGLDHSPSLNNLMFDTLSTGVRRLPAHLPHLMELLRSKVSN